MTFRFLSATSVPLQERSVRSVVLFFLLTDPWIAYATLTTAQHDSVTDLIVVLILTRKIKPSTY